MAKAKITKRSVDALKPGETVFDTELRGFMVRKQAKAIVFAVKYSVGGRQRIFTLGRYGDLTPDQARTDAQDALNRANKARNDKRVPDPQAERDAQRMRGRKTFADLAELYLEEHARPTNKPRSVAEDERLLRLHLLPALGKLDIEAVTKRDLFALRSRMKTRKVAFNRARTLASAIFNFAIERELRTAASPAAFVSEYPEKPRERILSAAEYGRLFDELNASEASEHPSVIACVRLLALTGARLSEILTLKWDWVDFDHAALRLPDSKTGAKTISLAPAAVEVLVRLPRLSPYVLPGAGLQKPFIGIQRPWRRIRSRASLPALRLHDLRHGFASLAVASGESMKLIGAALGHRQSSTTDRYAHLSTDPVRAMVDRTAAKIAAAANTGGDVVALKEPLRGT